MLPRGSALIGVALVGLSMILGGGGTTNPRTEIILEIALALVLLMACTIPRICASIGPIPVGARLVALPLVLLLIGQLVPLPPAIWRNLPGRDIERAALDLVGAGSAWMPLTISPPATLAALLSTLGPVAIMLYISALDLRERTAAALAIAVIAMVSVALGAAQIVHLGGETWSLYQSYSEGWLGGFQSNRNAEADVLQVAILAAAVVGLTRVENLDIGRLKLPIVFGYTAFMTIAVVMTGSRAGIALLPVTFAFAIAILWPRLKRKSRFSGRWIAGSAAALAIAGFGLTRIAAVETVIARFGQDTEGRWDFWMDTLYAIHKAWPVGTGIGTFPAAYMAVERLELVTPLYINRAHNDWLEWTLESGLIGWVAIVVTLIVLAWSARRAWRQSTARNGAPNGAVQHDAVHRGQILFAIAVLINEGLHALVDYPTRTMSLSALIAVAVAFLMPLPKRPDGSNSGQ